LSLLRDLESEATDTQVSVHTLLMKARILAARLGYEPFTRWVVQELNGYSDTDDLPEYRRGFRRLLRGTFFNGYWKYENQEVPLAALPETFRDGTLEQLDMRWPISAIEEFAKEDVIQFPAPAGMEQLVKLYDNLPCVQLWTEVSRHAFRRVIDAVRERLLEFSLEIEKANPAAGDGKVGDRPVDPARLQQIHQTVILGGGNIIGSAGRDIVQTNVTMRPGDVAAMTAELQRLGLADSEIEALKKAIKQDEPERAKGKLGSRVLAFLGEMTGKAATGAWQIGAQAGAQVLANILLQYYGIPH
jgi:hypothetical protein